MPAFGHLAHHLPLEKARGGFEEFIHRKGLKVTLNA
jgi:hypothetical protein